jgi:UDP-glucose 4-epimerase
MRIFITGGSGFIGRNLIEQLASRYQTFAPSSAELSLLNEQDVRDYLAAHHFDVVVHAATTRSNRRLGAPADMLDRNCRMFFNLARNAGEFGKMIHFGSGAEYGPRARLPLLVSEDYFDTHVPDEPYGFSKYICAKYIECTENIVDLRLFAVFGPYEDYTVRFISNACCRVLKGLPIVIRQDVLFDYMYVKDLAPITAWFIENQPLHKTYNVCSGKPVALTELGAIVAKVSENDPPVSVSVSGKGAAYTGDASRLLNALGTYKFTDPQIAITELYAWYRSFADDINPAALRIDG